MLIKVIKTILQIGPQKTGALILEKVFYYKQLAYWKFLTIVKPTISRSAYGPLLRTNILDGTFKFYITGGYGKMLSNFLLSHKEPFIFIDIGSNQGLYSLISANNYACRSVFAFEPVLSTYTLLSENIKINNQTHRILPINFAISATPGKAVINLNPLHSGGASLSHRSPNSTQETINCINGADLTKIVTNPDHLDIVIKIDTEGYEPVVMSELCKTAFWQSVTYVFFEVDDKWFDCRNVIELLERDGFKEIWRTDGSADHYDVMMFRGRDYGLKQECSV